MNSFGIGSVDRIAAAVDGYRLKIDSEVARAKTPHNELRGRATANYDPSVAIRNVMHYETRINPPVGIAGINGCVAADIDLCARRNRIREYRVCKTKRRS